MNRLSSPPRHDGPTESEALALMRSGDWSPPSSPESTPRSHRPRAGSVGSASDSDRMSSSSGSTDETDAPRRRRTRRGGRGRRRGRKADDAAGSENSAVKASGGATATSPAHASFVGSRPYGGGSPSRSRIGLTADGFEQWNISVGRANLLVSSCQPAEALAQLKRTADAIGASAFPPMQMFIASVASICETVDLATAAIAMGNCDDAAVIARDLHGRSSNFDLAPLARFLMRQAGEKQAALQAQAAHAQAEAQQQEFGAATAAMQSLAEAQVQAMTTAAHQVKAGGASVAAVSASVSAVAPKGDSELDVNGATARAAGLRLRVPAPKRCTSAECEAHMRSIAMMCAEALLTPAAEATGSSSSSSAWDATAVSAMPALASLPPTPSAYAAVWSTPSTTVEPTSV